MRVFFNAIIVQVVLSIYIYWWGWRALPDKKYIKIPYATVFIIELIIYFIGFFTSGSGLLPSMHCTIWHGSALHDDLCYLYDSASVDIRSCKIYKL